MDKNKMAWKGLLMTAISFIAAIVAQKGLPNSTVEWNIFAITIFGTIIIYFAQSILLPTTSSPGDINWKDALKGGLLAVGNMFVGLGAESVIIDVVDWSSLFKSAATLFVLYMAKQLVTQPSVK